MQPKRGTYIARFGIVLTVAMAGAATQIIERGPYRVAVGPSVAARDGDPALTVSITNKETNRTSSIVLKNNTASILDIFVPGPRELVALGELDGRGHAVSLLDAANGRLLDTIWAWRLSVSRNSRYMAYEFRYPPHGLPMYRNSVLLLYDFLEPHDMPRTTDDDAKKGIILYPEENRSANRYSLPSKDLEPRNTRLFTSPIEWSRSDTKIAVLESFEGETALVLVAFEADIYRPRVKRLRIDKKPFLSPGEKSETLASSETELPLSAKELSFVDDDTAVIITSEGIEPFAQTTVRLSLLDGSQALVGKADEGARPAAPPADSAARRLH